MCIWVAVLDCICLLLCASRIHWTRGRQAPEQKDEGQEQGQDKKNKGQASTRQEGRGASGRQTRWTEPGKKHSGGCMDSYAKAIS